MTKKSPSPTLCEFVFLAGLGVLILVATRKPICRYDEKPPDPPFGNPLLEAEWRVRMEQQAAERKRLKAQSYGHRFNPCTRRCLVCGLSELDFRDSLWDGQDAHIVVCSSIIEGSDKPLTMREIWWNSQLALQDKPSIPNRG